MTQASSLEVTEKGIDITRIFKADASTVYDAWTKPEHFSVWFGGHGAEVPVESVAMDVRAGGTWKATMYAGSERHQIDWYGEFREVDPPSRLVYTLADRPGDEREVVTVELKDLGDNRTEMTFRQEGGHMDADEYQRAAEGWSTFFDTMDEVLANL